MQRIQTRHASWQELLTAPAPASHILQIYDRDEFLAAAVGYFAAEGLRRNEAVLLTGTEDHVCGVENALRSHGIDPASAWREGRLTGFDVREAAARILVDGAIDPTRFQATAGEALAKARADSRFSGVRWWGEISNFLQTEGNLAAALAAEDLGDALAKEHGVRVLCSYLYDRFDPHCYDTSLVEVCGKHSHVIPAENYVMHRLAVNRAMAEVVGELKGPLLQSLMSWKGLSCDLPSSQAILFWIRETMPEHFAHVLERAKAYHATQAGMLECGDAEPA